MGFLRVIWISLKLALSSGGADLCRNQASLHTRAHMQASSLLVEHCKVTSSAGPHAGSADVSAALQMWCLS